MHSRNIIKQHILNGLLSDVFALNYIPEIDGLFDIDQNGNTVCFVHILQSKDLNCVQWNNCVLKWTNRVLLSLTNSEEDHGNTAEILGMYLAEKIPAAIPNVILDLGLLVVVQMTAVQTFAMAITSNVNFKQQHIIACHMAVHCEGCLFAPEVHTKNILGGEFIETSSGTYQNGSEKVGWWYKDATAILL